MTTQTDQTKNELPVLTEFADALLDNVYETWDQIRDTLDIPEEVKTLVDSMRNLSFYIFQESTTPDQMDVASVNQDVADAINAIVKIQGLFGDSIVFNLPKAKEQQTVPV